MMYGNVINRVMEQSKTPEIVVGMGATECLWSDRHAYEVIAVQDEKHITVRRLNASLKPGTTWLDQEYEYSSNPDNPPVHLYKTPKGWRERFGRNSLGDNIFVIGRADEYYDPSF